VRGPCDNESLTSLAQMLFVWSRRFGSGSAALEGEDLVGDLEGEAEGRFTGLFVGDRRGTSIISSAGRQYCVFT
jgi:hypothetical protein